MELLDYNPETGEFRWKVNRRGKAKAGSVAGSLNRDGYLTIGIKGAPYKAHRLAWFIVTGAWPNGQIDHINGVRSDNRIENLRDVSRSINLQNQKRARSDNKLRCLGVTWHKASKKFCAQIQANGKNIHLGLFDTLLDAAAARKSAELHYFPEKPRC